MQVAQAGIVIEADRPQRQPLVEAGGTGAGNVRHPRILVLVHIYSTCRSSIGRRCRRVARRSASPHAPSCPFAGSYCVLSRAVAPDAAGASAFLSPPAGGWYSAALHEQPCTNSLR